MKSIVPIFIIGLSSPAMGADSVNLSVFTPEVVTDNKNAGPKGAVQLVWQKGNDQDQYEVQVSNGHSIFSDVNHRNFKHIMLYFNKDYKWRVRKVNRESESKFSDWKFLKVVRSSQLAQARVWQSSNPEDLESLFVDQGED